MKKIFSILIICLSIKTFGQTPNWSWAHSAGSNFTDAGASVTNDSDGNVYMTGSFMSPSITFGTITLNNSNTTTADIFIVKYDPAGNVLWARSAGGTGRDDGNGIATDTAGNVFITGEFYSSSITFGTTILNNSTSFKTFIVKYGPSGNVVWARSSSGSGTDVGRSIATDVSGNVFVTGYFGSPSITFGTTTLTNSSGSTVFTVKYDGSGNFLWARSSSGSFSDISNQIVTDAAGNAFITGAFTSTSITFGTVTLTNAGSGGTYDIFLVKYDPAGNVLWAERGGVGFYYDQGISASTDPAGNVFITGYFTAQAITFGTTTLYNGGAEDIFIVKYSSMGNVVWAKSAGDAANDNAADITNDASGNVYIAGSFTSATITFGTFTLTNAGNKDIFVVKYSPTGLVIWARSTGGTSHDYCSNLSIDVNNNVFLTGGFQSSLLPFGSISLNNAGTTAYYDAFIASLSTTTAIEEKSQKINFTIAPNPFTYQTNITFSEVQKNSTIKIIDILGKEINEINFSGKELIIEKGLLKEGLYFLQVTDEKNIVTNRIIIIK